MESSSSPALKVNPDVWQLIFDQLAGDYTSLCNVALTCRTWRTLSEPSLFKVVDISSHNNGRLPELEFPNDFPVVHADYSAEYRPRNLISRQRSFLRVVCSRNSLAKYVQAFVWTLVWLDWSEQSITDTDRQTWAVFSLMENVTRLDLASLHDVCDESYVRQNPSDLFPRVTNLRLAGWMHRGLVKAIVTTLDATKLRVLQLHHLQDEGAMPDGGLMSYDVALEYAHHSREGHGDTKLVDNELFRRQENGEAAIFPGPMWYPLRLLSAHSLGSLKQIQVKVALFNAEIDLRNYFTIFEETAELILKANATLSTLEIVFGEHRNLYEETRHQSTCGTSWTFFRTTCRPWCIHLAKAFLDQILAVLRKGGFQYLSSVRLEGFRFLELASPEEKTTARLDQTIRTVRRSPLQNASFTDYSHVDYRESFLGYDCEEVDLEVLRPVLENG